MNRLSRLVLSLLLVIANPCFADQPLPEKVEINGVEFILIPAGDFWYSIENGLRFNYHPVGTPAYRQVNVWLPAYYLATYEASADDLVRFMNSADTPTPLREAYLNEWQQGGGGEQQSGSGCTVHLSKQGEFVVDQTAQQLPATYLSWNHAQAFAAWMGFRLPSEAEWQKAARGSDRKIWPWGDEYPDDTLALYGASKGCTPDAANALPEGRSPYGHYHMAGNVSEYVQDWFNEHRDAEMKDGMRNPPLATQGSDIPHQKKQHQRISKGGRWSQNATAITIGYRQLVRPARATNRDGARFAIDAQEVENLLKQQRAKVLTSSVPKVSPRQ